MDGEELDDRKSVEDKTLNHLWKLGNHLFSTCPSLSRFYIFNFANMLSVLNKPLNGYNKKVNHYCKHCHNLWSPDNHRVRIKPPSPPNRHIKKLLKLQYFQPWKLNSRQKRKLRKFQESTSKIVYTCFVCKKVTKYPGKTRKCKKPVVPNPPVLRKKSKKADVNAGLFIPVTPFKNSSSEHQKDLVDVQERPSTSSDITMGTEIPVFSTTGNKGLGGTTLIGDFSRQNSNALLNPKSKRQSNIKQMLPRTLSEKNSFKTMISAHSVNGKKANKKKKTSLLTQILNQEKEEENKKPSLTSFLIPF